MATSTSTTITTTVGATDPRAVDRGGTETGTTGTTATHGRPQHHAGNGGDPGDTNLDAQQVQEQTATVTEAAQRAVDTLGAGTTARYRGTMTFRGGKPDDSAFASTMAKVQQKEGARLGHLNSNPNTILSLVGVANAAGDAVAGLTSYINFLNNVKKSCLQEAVKMARPIYNRAKQVSTEYPEVADDIAPFRDTYSRRSKKGASTRKTKAAGKGKAADQGTQAMPAQDAGATTTATITTTQK